MLPANRRIGVLSDEACLLGCFIWLGLANTMLRAGPLPFI